ADLGRGLSYERKSVINNSSEVVDPREKIVFDYISAQVGEAECLYIKIDIFGQEFYRVTNSEICDCLDVVFVPIRLKVVVKLIDLYVVSRLRQSIILGMEFWVIKMGIIPNLPSSKNEPSVLLTKQILDESDQRSCLAAVAEGYFRQCPPGELFGCTNVIKLRIIANNPRIK
ncbi:hypothetical protein ILUMI_05424, partial [Ignelater luminosus]